MRKILGLFAILVTSTALAQWTYAPSPDECVNPETGQRFDPSVDGRKNTRVACGAIEDFEGWLASLPFDALKSWFESVIPEATAQVSPAIAYNGTSFDSENRTGTPGSGALDSFTTTSMGNLQSCDVSDDNGVTTPDTSYTFTTLGGADQDYAGGNAGICTANNTFDASVNDLELLLRFSSTEIHNGQAYAGGGAYIQDSNDISGTVFYAWLQRGNLVVSGKSMEGQVTQSAVYTGAVTTPIYIGLQYDQSAGTCAAGTSTNGTTWTIVDTTITCAFGVGANYGYFATARSEVASVQYTLDNLDFDTTINETFGSFTPPASGSDEEPDYVDPVSGVTLLGGRTNVPVATSAALAAAINGAACGDNIVVADGTYTTAATLDTQCASNNPVKIYGTTQGGSIFNFKLTISAPSSYAVIGGPGVGIGFTGANSAIDIGGINNKIIGNEFANWATTNVIRFPRDNVTWGTTDDAPEIAYNIVRDPATCTGNGARRWIQDHVYNNVSTSSVTDPWIHHNHIIDFVTECEQGDLLDFGSSSRAEYVHTLDSGMYFEYNLIDGFDNVAPASHGVLFDYKLGGGLLRGNTVVNSPDPGQARLQQRHGYGGRFVRNHTDATITILHRDGIVACNLAPRINIMAGTTDIGGPYTANPVYVRSQDKVVVSNNATLYVGHEYDVGWTYPADGTSVEDHTGTVNLNNHTNTTQTGIASYTCDIATPLNANQVGQLGLANASAAYNAARGF